MQSPLSLFQLNTLAAEAMVRALPGRYNVVAEISELSARGSGHCYLTFIEKGVSGDIVAKASAHIWRNKWTSLDARFRKAAGQSLSAGMKVLATVEIELHVQYGYSLNVVDIDPAYTLGEQARRRQETIKQLKEDGVYDMQRGLKVSRPLMNLAVVSSPTAAGYDDFCRQLEQSGYTFRTELFAAVMQGTSSPASVIAALERAVSEGTDYDAVIIIRGGGAVDDLMCFDDYELASVVAQLPLPVFTGIGHERDTSVVDLVAHLSFKTPTAVAAFLIETRRAELETLADLEERLRDAATDCLRDRMERFAYVASRLQMFAAQFGNRGRERMLRLASRMEMAARQLLNRQNQRAERFADRLPVLAERRLQLERQKLALVEKHVELANPDRILRLGFSITTCGGRVVKDVNQLSDGDLLETRLAKGTIRSRVTGAKD